MPQKPMHPTAVQHATAAACAGGHHLECMATRTPTLNKVSLATQTEAHERARPTRAVRWDHKVVLKQCSKNPYTRITPRLALTSILLFYNFICRFIRQLFASFPSSTTTPRCLFSVSLHLGLYLALVIKQETRLFLAHSPKSRYFANPIRPCSFYPALCAD